MLGVEVVKSPERRIRRKAAGRKHKIKETKPSYENFYQAHDREIEVLNRQIFHPLQTTIKPQFQVMQQVQQENIFAVIHFVKEVCHQLFPILTKIHRVASLVNAFLYFSFLPLAPVKLSITEKLNVNGLEFHSFTPIPALCDKSKYVTG